MTNTPASIRRGATAIARGTRTTERDMDLAREFSARSALLSNAGGTNRRRDGRYPAVVRVRLHSNRGVGRRWREDGLVARSCSGSRLKLFWRGRAGPELGHSPEELRRMVVTPGGTTAAGLAVMERGERPVVSAPRLKRPRRGVAKWRRKTSRARPLHQSAARITSIGASRPNQISNASAPWCSNIDNPLADRARRLRFRRYQRRVTAGINHVVNHQMRRREETEPAPADHYGSIRAKSR